MRTLSGGLWRLLDDQIGDERIIGMRREVAKLHNMVNECVDQSKTQTRIMVGSQAEGLAMKYTDSDTMFVDFNVIVLQSQQKQKNDDRKILTVKMEQKLCKPGFTLLKILDGQTPNSTNIFDDDYLSSQKRKENSHFNHPGSRTTGPSNSGTLGDSEHDLTEAVKLHIWPEVARGCLQRLLRRGWPDHDTVLKMVKRGCHLVPKSSRTSQFPDEEWMISFVIAEQILIAKLTHSQFLCYCLLKIFFKEAVNDVLKTSVLNEKKSYELLEKLNNVQKTSKVINEKTVLETAKKIGITTFNDCDSDYLSSYLAKTIILWQVSDGRLKCTPDNLLGCFWSCFRLILKWLSKNYIPNFFIPDNNMLEGKFTEENRLKLMKHLSVLYKKGYRCLYECSTLKNSEFVHSQHFSYKLHSNHVLTEEGSPRLYRVGKKHKKNSRKQFTLRSKDRVGMIWVKYPEAIVGLQSHFYASFVLAIENYGPCGASHLKDIDHQTDLVKRIELVQTKIKNKTDVQEHTLSTWFHMFSIKLVFTYFIKMVTKLEMQNRRSETQNRRSETQNRRSETQNRRMYHTFRKVKEYILKDKEDLVTEKLYYAIILYEMGKDDGIIKKLTHLQKRLEQDNVVFTFLTGAAGVEKSLEHIMYTGDEIHDFRTWKKNVLQNKLN